MLKIILLVCFLYVKEVHSFVNLADVPCGVGGAGARSARVVGGAAARPGQFPWLGSLTRRGGHYCGATVLNKRWMLTAGHCICSGTNELIRPTTIRVTLGEHDLTKPEVPVSRELRIELIVPHPQHKCGKPRDDLALIRLAEDVTWSEVVAPACLPDGPSGKSYSDYAGTPATVAGWGWLNEHSSKGGRANELQKVDVSVLQNELCQEWYVSQGKKTKINPGQMCAGDEQGGKDSCWADSGGPLMWSQGGQPSAAPMVIGVVSTGIGCGRPRLPGLYTRISEYMDWIQENAK